MSDGRYNQAAVVSGVTRFEKAPESGADFSRMRENPRVLTAFDAGEIVPVQCIEILPNETYSVSVQEVIRQATVKTPTMGELIADMYAFFVPNRVVNDSWKSVQGENTAGTWNAPDVNCAPLYVGSEAVQIPVGSVADYYGIPTQKAMPASVLALMNDFPFRGYVAIWNEYFRDQNYQPPIPYSKANVYEGFLLSSGTVTGVDGSAKARMIDNADSSIVSDGSFPDGALLYANYGAGSSAANMTGDMAIPARKTSWSALSAPLKANKLHDAITSVLPSPQKGPAVTFALADSAPVSVNVPAHKYSGATIENTLRFRGIFSSATNVSMNSRGQDSGYAIMLTGGAENENPVFGLSGDLDLPALGNLSGIADLSQASAISVDDLRLGFALQQLYELYGRSGSRYRELCHALFGVSADDPYMDIPKMLGHIRVPLELYQTAQTSASSDESPQGSLAAFGYTNKGGFLFKETFLEHGYVHILVVVRQRNMYPSYLAPHWFRVNKLDFYTPILANISEQPMLLRTVNPFGVNPNSTVFGYQEAWWEYRQHPDVVTGILRSGAPQDLSVWTYQDDFNPSQSSADASFMESNAKGVVDKTIAVSSENGPQFKALFSFTVDHVFPGPVYSVPGLDVI